MTGHRPLRIGALLFEGLDQIDFTGPYEVLAKVSESTFTTYGPVAGPIADTSGLVLRVDAVLEEAPQLDVLLVPGGPGQQELMHDERVLAWLRSQAAGATSVFSVCTGALLLGAAGLLRGVRATTHWACVHLLPYFGADASDERVVIDGRLVSAGGVTAGIDGALRVAELLRGTEAAQTIQLLLQYAPEPPFDCGTPATAPRHIVDAARRPMGDLTAARLVTARRFAEGAAGSRPTGTGSG
ncbi:DJ-1/PfpI family protein [Amycolatopsis kentuckyensis]|uniref:DJ-1/PfpI family protein n=1 Tax=Amycolatopsis kentuckyensis TaxID=218823 RepID=UPI0035627BC6